MLMKSSRKASALASSCADVGTRVAVGVGEGLGTGVAVGVTNGSGVAVGVGVGKGMLDAATAPETGGGVAMLDVAMGSETLLGLAAAVGVKDGNVLRTGVSLVCWGPSWLEEQANEPAINTTKMEISVCCAKGLCLQQWLGVGSLA